MFGEKFHFLVFLMLVKSSSRNSSRLLLKNSPITFYYLDLGVEVKSYEEIVKILPQDRRPRPIVLIGERSL